MKFVCQAFFEIFLNLFFVAFFEQILRLKLNINQFHLSRLF